MFDAIKNSRNFMIVHVSMKIWNHTKLLEIVCAADFSIANGKFCMGETQQSRHQ
jgi:hypothetical protein